MCYLSMISKSELEDQLRSEFDIVCYIDLAEVARDHGMIFRLFKQIYQAHYAPQQRVVLFAGQTPSQLILDHVQRAASKIDISNFFILIYAPDDISAGLESARLKFGQDIAIANRCATITDAKQFDSIRICPPETLCMMPFVHLTVDSSRRTKACCKFSDNQDLVLNEHLELDIAKAMNSDTMKNLREAMYQGRRHPGCHVCWSVEKSGGTSLRQQSMDKYRAYEEHIGTDPAIAISVDIIPGNLCNFKCRICDEYSSSAIAAEKHRLEQNSKEKTHLLTLMTDKSWSVDNLVTELFVDKENLRFFHVFGGEPMLFKGIKPLLTTMIELGLNQTVSLEFNTNASIWDDDLITLIRQFRNIEILLSIDDIGRRFELQRGGNWSNIDQNVRRWAVINSGTQIIKLICTINIQNVLYLDQIVAYSQELGLDIVWHYLEQPDFLSIDNMTLAAKHAVQQRFTNHSVTELRAIADRMQHTNPVSGDKFLTYIRHLDNVRQQDFCANHAEIYFAMCA